MSEPNELKPEAVVWRDELQGFLESYRERTPLPSEDALSAVEDEQRRVTGGSLMQFLQFLQNEAAFEAFPVLEEEPIGERIFVFATDAAGVVASRDLVDPDSDRGMVVTKREWRAWLDTPSTDSDEMYEHHYEYWSVWHQNFRADWELPELETEDAGEAEGTDEYWVHEEGFALADRAGRGARHLWRWDGDELELLEQGADEWTSSPRHPE